MGITLDQARNNIDQVLAAVRLTREEHQCLRESLGMLYDGAKEHEEDRQEPVFHTGPKIIPRPSVTSPSVMREGQIKKFMGSRPACPKTGEQCTVGFYEQTCSDCTVNWKAFDASFKQTLKEPCMITATPVIPVPET